MAPTLFDRDPKPGDLIEIFRGPYSHWAVYIGDNEVVHLSPQIQCGSGASGELRSILNFSTAQVKRQKIWDVVGGSSTFQINNILDDRYQPRQARIIVRKARRLVGRRLTYNVATHNCEHFVTELRYGKPESRQFVCEPKPGDLIEMVRTPFSHWAVYIGDNEVVHLSPQTQCGSGASGELLSMLNFSTAQVKRQKIWEVISSSTFQINNVLDDRYQPRHPDIIVREACRLVGQQQMYNVATRNCEHFVTELRYGKPESRQVQKAAVIGVIAAASLGSTGVAFAALGTALYCLFKDSNKRKES